MDLNKLWQKIYEAQNRGEEDIELKTEEGEIVKVHLHNTGWYSDYY